MISPVPEDPAYPEVRPKPWRFTAIGCAAVAATIAVSNLVGWLIGSRELISWVANLVPMKITGSLTVIAISVPILGVAWKGRIETLDRWLLRAGALVSMSAGFYGVGTSVFERVRAHSLALPEHLTVRLAEDPMWIPLASGISFLLFGIALWQLPRDWVEGRYRASALALAAAGNSILTLFGYVYGIPSFFDERIYVPMPLAVAFAFLFLAASINTLRPQTSIFSILLSDTITARSSRFYLLAALLLPFGLALVHQVLVGSALISEKLGDAIEATLVVIFLVTLVLVTAVRGSREERRAIRLKEERDREMATRRAFWEISEDMLCVANLDGYFEELNPSWTALLGWSAEELTARPFIEFVHPDDRKDTLEVMGELDSGARTTRFLNRYRNRDGDYRWLQWNATPDREGNVFAVARDVTSDIEERMRSLDAKRDLEIGVKLRTRELEAANEELKWFSYAVSHDLRAPLRAIEGFSKILLDRYQSHLPDEGQHFLTRVRAGAVKMSEMIDGILGLSRISRRDLRNEPLDLTGIAREVVQDLRDGDPGRRVEVEIENGMTGHGDPALIRSLLINLIENAWKFTSKTDSARITFSSLPDQPDTFEIRDNGVGFDTAHADKLFSPFQRLHSRDEFDGTGLGLATVQRIINRHGGQIRAESEPGEGATFRFSLPASDERRIEAAIETSRGLDTPRADVAKKSLAPADSHTRPIDLQRTQTQKDVEHHGTQNSGR